MDNLILEKHPLFKFIQYKQVTSSEVLSFWFQLINKLFTEQFVLEVTRLLKSHQLTILLNDSFVAIQDLSERQFKIDFLNDHLQYRKLKAGLNSEPLAKAMGRGKKGFRAVDLTAGLAVDSLFLAQLGFTITAVERNPLIYFTLKLSFEMAQKNEPVFQSLQLNHLTFEYGNALDFLKMKQIENVKFDVGYFDPMFPQKKKSALPKQEMVMFKGIVGEDLDAEDVIKQILQLNCLNRLVVKRPLKALPFAKPSGCIEGKVIRYDIYT